MPSTAPAGVAAPRTPRFRVHLTARNVRWSLVVIAVVAVLLRVLSALYQGNAVETLPGVYDQVSYDGLARRVVQGFGFSFAEGHWPATPAGAPTAHWSYLYTLYLSASYALFGTLPLAARLIQAVAAGVLHTWLAWRIGRRVFGPAAALLAALFSAVYIYFFYYAGALITETFYIISVLWVFDITLRIADRANQAAPRASRWPAWLIWAELGLAIGVTALLRQLFVLFVPLIFLWLWWMISRPRAQTGDPAVGRWRRLLGWGTLHGFVLAGIVTAVLILPWTVRNYRAFGSFVLLNTNAGYVFYWANHPIYGSEFVGILPAEGPTYADLLPKELLTLNEADLDRALMVRGLEFVRDDPVRYALLSLSRAREYFKFWPSSESSTISNISRVGSFGLFLPFMLYGVILAAVHAVRRRDARFRAQVLLLDGFMLAYVAVHMLTWTLIRYRLPVDAFLLLFAAYGVVDLLRRLGVQVDAAPELDGEWQVVGERLS